MDKISLINLGVIVIMALFLYSGYRRGCLMKLLSLLGFFAAGIIAWLLSDPISDILSLYPKQQVPMQGTFLEGMLYDSLNRLLLFLVLFVLLELVVWMMKPIARLAQHIPVLSTINRLCGVLVGGIQGILLLSVFSLFLSLPFVQQGEALVKQSYLQYSAPMTSAMWRMVEKPLMQLPVFSQGETALTPQDKEELRQWLLDRNIEKESVDALMEVLR